MKVLIYGATGSQMRPLVRQLIDRGHEPHLLTRNAEAAETFPMGSRVVLGDLGEPASLHRASASMDAVAFMLPAFLERPEESFQYVEHAGAAAAAAGVELIVWNTSGRYPMPDEHRERDEYMRAIHERLARFNVPLIVIAPTTYMENLLGPWTRDAVRAGCVGYPVLPDRKMGWIASRDLCALIAAALERPRLAGRLFRVSGIEAPTGPELAAIFSQVLGRDLRYRTLSPQEMKASLESAFGPGAGDEVAAEYAADQADPQPPLKYYEMSDVLAQLPVRMTPLRDWLAEHRHVFSEG